jgi:DNA polymerase-3 subunit epsilon
MYAILDIETTGGKFNEEGITEIAIHKFDGHQVVDKFISLVNPEKDIQPFVVRRQGQSKRNNTPKLFYALIRLKINRVYHNIFFD